MNTLADNSNYFDAFIDNRIYSRGLYYWFEGLVYQLKETEKGNWTAKVKGTRLYSVKVEIKDNKVNKFHCSCPFEGEPPCKHIVATVFSIRAKNKEPDGFWSNDEKLELAGVLNELTQFRFIKAKFDYLLHEAPNMVYEMWEYFESIHNGEKKLKKEEIDRVKKKLPEIEKQVNAIGHILYQLDYGDNNKQLYRLQEIIGYLEELIPKLKKSL